MAFEYLKNRVNGLCIVALDEFSHLVEADETIPSVFQTIVDDVLVETEISLVLLGSSISMMEEGVLSYGSLLHQNRILKRKRTSESTKRLYTMQT